MCTAEQRVLLTITGLGPSLLYLDQAAMSYRTQGIIYIWTDGWGDGRSFISLFIRLFICLLIQNRKEKSGYKSHESLAEDISRSFSRSQLVWLFSDNMLGHVDGV